MERFTGFTSVFFGKLSILALVDLSILAKVSKNYPTQLAFAKKDRC